MSSESTDSDEKMNQLGGAPAFLYDIPSIHQRYPGMPADLRNLDLNHSIAAGDPLEYHHVEQAKELAKTLKTLHGEVHTETDISDCRHG